MDKCPYCGAKTRPGDNFCLNCGNRLLSAAPSYQQAQPDDGPEQEHSRRKASYDQIHVGEKIYERRRAESKLGYTRRILLLIGIPVLIILFVGALLLQITKQSNTSETTEKPGTLLCDGALSGWDGWTAAPEWTAQNGILSSAGTSSASTLLITPCTFETTHYALETKIQVAGTTPGSRTLPCFYIGPQGFTDQVDNVPTWTGHEIAINCSGNNMIQLIFADESVPQNTTVEAQAHFNPGLLYHTYRIEVRENNYRLFVDGTLLFAFTDNIEMVGEIALDSYHMQVNMSSFRVIAL